MMTGDQSLILRVGSVEGVAVVGKKWLDTAALGVDGLPIIGSDP